MPVDLNSIKKTDLGALIAGALALVVSVFPSFLTGSIEGAGELAGLAEGYDTGISAWEGAGALAMLLILAATAVVAVKVFAPHVLPAGVPSNLIAAALAGLGTVILLLRVLTNIDSEESFGIKVSFGPGWSGILLLLLTIALTVCAALGFKDSGEALPWHKQGAAATGGQAGPMGGTQAGGSYAGPGSDATMAPPAAQQPPAQPSVQPTAPMPGVPVPPPAEGAPIAPSPQGPAPGSTPGAPGSGGVPPTGDDQPRRL